MDPPEPMCRIGILSVAQTYGSSHGKLVRRLDHVHRQALLRGSHSRRLSSIPRTVSQLVVRTSIHP